MRRPESYATENKKFESTREAYLSNLQRRAGIRVEKGKRKPREPRSKPEAAS